MECRYCQAANADDDHRCRRCGRRLRMSPVYTGRQRPRRFCNTRPRRFCNTRPRRCSHETHRRAGTERAAPPRSPINLRSLPRANCRWWFNSKPSRLIRCQPSPRKPQTSAPRQRRRKVIPGQASSRVHSPVCPIAILQAGGWRHLLRRSGCDPRASRDGGRPGCQHYRSWRWLFSESFSAWRAGHLCSTPKRRPLLLAWRPAW